MIAWVIEEEFGIHYHPGHVRKLLHRAGFSVQRPRRVLARANAYQQDRWQRYTYPSLKKKRSDKTGRPAYARPVAGLRFCGNAPVHSRRHTRPELRRQPQSCRNHTDQMRNFADTARIPASPLWQIAVETAERTVAAWKTLEQADLLPKEMRASIEKQILAVAATLR